MITDKRTSRLIELVATRQRDLIVILENVHDPHNIGAVVRTCDSVGICEVHIVYTKTGGNYDIRYVGKKASRGSSKWVDVFFHNTLEECMQEVRKKVDVVAATHLGADSVNLYEQDFNKRIAIMLGNEKDGLSERALAMADINIAIPMFGMVQSLNISIACATILFEAMRQRVNSGRYNEKFDFENKAQVDLLGEYIARSKPRIAEADNTMISKWVEQIKESVKPESL